MPKKLVSLSRSVVHFLGEHPWSRKPFFWSTFFTLRLAFPLEYLLLRDLMDCESVLDLGCGRHSMVPIVGGHIRTVGVEGFKPHYELALEKKRHSEYIFHDITTIDFPDRSFDAVVLLDVLEHLGKEEGARMIEKMQRWAKKKVIVFTPNGYLPQDEYDENPLMAHRSGWTSDEFEARGFRVRGVRGFKALRSTTGHEVIESRWIDRVKDLTQVITYHFPKSAFQLYCVKDCQ